MDRVKIEYDHSESGFYASRKYTDIPKREKHEIIMKNLCSFLGINTIQKVMDSRMNIYYKPNGFSCYQSATNTIIELTEQIIDKDT
ncbi:hypothetical protein AKN89_01055 [Thiopseudomonas alkaliphila]|nr:hypothetical protein AKN92_01055 [Thiopseudomonas alkaliphila]AKX56570.1 hypothetical protein AKN89_01055 [Thiopseudomonas alkaliphila]